MKINVKKVKQNSRELCCVLGGIQTVRWSIAISKADYHDAHLEVRVRPREGTVIVKDNDVEACSNIP